MAKKYVDRQGHAISRISVERRYNLAASRIFRFDAEARQARSDVRRFRGGWQKKAARNRGKIARTELARAQSDFEFWAKQLDEEPDEGGEEWEIEIGMEYE